MNIVKQTCSSNSQRGSGLKTLSATHSLRVEVDGRALQLFCLYAVVRDKLPRSPYNTKWVPALLSQAVMLLSVLLYSRLFRCGHP